MRYLEATPKQCQNLNLEHLDWDFDNSKLVTDDINQLTEECNNRDIAVAIDKGELKILIPEATAETLGVEVGSEKDLEEVPGTDDETTPMTREEITEFVADYVDKRIKDVLEKQEVITAKKLQKMLRFNI